MLKRIAQHSGFRQFVKFCIVGASSTLISAGVFVWLVYFVHLNDVLYGTLKAWPQLRQLADRSEWDIHIAAAAGFLSGITNGFFWNNRWTFRQADREGVRLRYVKFMGVNSIGLVLIQVILFLLNNIVPAGRLRPVKGIRQFLAFEGATVIAGFFNFLASKYWTFRHEVAGGAAERLRRAAGQRTPTPTTAPPRLP